MNAPDFRPDIKQFSDESRRMLTALIETVREAVIAVDSNLRITAVNAKATEGFAKGHQPLTGRRLSEIIRDLDLHRAFRKALEENRAVTTELEIISNERRFYDVTINAVEIAGERIAIGFFDDVTQVERLERVRQEFLSNISH